MDDSWVKHIRAQLLALEPTLTPLLAIPPNQDPDTTPERAFYTEHISVIPKPVMPCVSVHATTSSGMPPHLLAEQINLYVDVWVPDTGPQRGKAGLWQIYRKLWRHLNLSQKPERSDQQNPFSTATFLIKWMVQRNVDDSGYDPDYHAYHLAAVYFVQGRVICEDYVFGL